MNLQLVHIVMLLLGALTVACQFVAANFPQYAAAAHAASGLLTAITAAIGVVSPSALTTAPAGPPPGATKAVVDMKTDVVEQRLEQSAK